MAGVRRTICWLELRNECVDAVQGGIETWLENIKKAGIHTTQSRFGVQTKAVAMLNSEFVERIDYAAGDYIPLPLEKAVIDPIFVTAKDDPDGKLATYATVVRGTPDSVDTLPLVPNLQRGIRHTFIPSVSGDYELWIRVKALNAERSLIRAFTPKLLGVRTLEQDTAGPESIVEFFSGTTNGWTWIPILRTYFAGTTSTFALTAGVSASVGVYYRFPEIKYSMMVLAKKGIDFQGSQFLKQYRQIKVPLPVPDSFIIATVWDLNTSSEAKKAVGVVDLRIESPVKLRIKSIYPLINGVFNPQHSSYTSVDTTAGGPILADRVIKTGGSAGATWVVDTEKDQLSFGFEELRIEDQ